MTESETRTEKWPNAVKEWTYDGRKCAVVEVDGRHFAGYAKTPLEFSYGNLSGVYDSGVYNLVDIHGGVTYGVDEDGWIGFNCGHAGDACVKEDGSRESFLSTPTNVWTVEGVAEEVEKLADQLTLLESFAQEVADGV